jgi:prolyl oligopeptidase
MKLASPRVQGPVCIFVLSLFSFACLLFAFSSASSLSAQTSVPRSTPHATQGAAPKAAPKCPPDARTDNVKDTYGSTVVTDPYRWLENQTSPETRAWIDAEDACTYAAIRHLPGRDTLTQRFTALAHVDKYDLPVERGGRYFFSKRLADQDLSLIYMRRSATSADQVLVNPLPWSADHSANATLEAMSHSGHLLFYGRRDGGQDETTIHIMDIDAHRDLPDILPKADYFSVEPTPDDRGVYYTRTTPAGPRVFYHAVGSDAAKDPVIFGGTLTKDKIPQIELSEDGKYLAIVVYYGSGSQKAEVYFKNVQRKSPVVTVVNDLNSLFNAHFGGDTLYIVTNWNAPNWHVYSIDAAAPSLTRDRWKEIIPTSDAALTDITPAGGKLFALYTRNAAAEVKIFSADGKSSAPFPLPTLGTLENFSGEWDSPHLLYDFDSFASPDTVYDYDVSASRASVWARPNVPVQADDYETQQVWYQSKDGTRVPMFLFSKKGIQMDGARPTLLTGYGGFNLTETPIFSGFYIVWADHGGVVAMPSLRGGGEFGESWHQAGMLQNKQNVFDDFIAAGEYLVNNKITNPLKLSIWGGSNGGLLVGAALTQRPDLFRAVVCTYPLLDMLRYQKFEDGPYWVPEYGSSDDPKQFVWLDAYSPYQHVKQGTDYPAVLFITGDGDTRVAPLHARKMAALLQASTGAADHPVLLLYDKKSGHSGGRPVSNLIEEGTDMSAFLFWQLDVPLP